MPPISSFKPLSATRANVLIADHDAHSRLMLRHWIAGIEIPVITVATGHEALLHLRTKPFSLAILDTHLPDLDGLRVFREALRNGCTTPVIFISGNPPVETVVRAMKMGARDFIIRPIIKRIFGSSTTH